MSILDVLFGNNTDKTATDKTITDDIPKKNKMYRQGDVLLVEIDVPNAKLEEVKELVVAEGEVTGHKHVLRGNLWTNHKDKVVVVNEPAFLSHEQHGPIKVEVGTYKIVHH